MQLSILRMLDDFVPDNYLVQRIGFGAILCHDEDKQLFDIPVECGGKVSMQVEGQYGHILFIVAAQRFDGSDTQYVDGRESRVINSAEPCKDCQGHNDGEAKEYHCVQAHPDGMHFFLRTRSISTAYKIIKLCRCLRARAKSKGELIKKPQILQFFGIGF